MEWILPDANSCCSQLTLSHEAFILFKYCDDDKFVNKGQVIEETQRLASALFISFVNC